MVGLRAHLFLGFACDRRFVPLHVGAAGVGADERGAAHPAGDRRAADVAVDDTNGHIRAELRAQAGAEMVGDRRHAGDLRCHRRLPAGSGLRGLVDAAGLGRVIEAQQWIGCRGNRLGAMFARVQFELHVALPAGEPDFADHHIGEIQTVCFM